jgi:hypothetical protein
VQILDKKQLEDAAKCCEGCYSCSFVVNIKTETGTCRGCGLQTDDVVETALAYRAMLERLEHVETGHIEKHCPVCGTAESIGHQLDCELASTIEGGVSK